MARAQRLERARGSRGGTWSRRRGASSRRRATASRRPSRRRVERRSRRRRGGAARRATSSALRKAIATLDDAIDEHLAFARKSTLREYSESIGVAVAIALFLRAFVVEAFQIPSGSMIPTLEVGDHIFVSKFIYGLGDPVHQHQDPAATRKPERGDVIVFMYPNEHEHRLHQARRRPAGRRRRGARSDELYVNGSRCRASACRAPCHYSETRRSRRPPEEHDCELWMETLGEQASTTTIQEPGTAARDFAAHGRPAGPRLRHGRQPRQLVRLARLGHRRPRPHQGPGADRLVVARRPTDGWSLVAWFKAIRWSRFFQSRPLAQSGGRGRGPPAPSRADVRRERTRSERARPSTTRRRLALAQAGRVQAGRLRSTRAQPSGGSAAERSGDGPLRTRGPAEAQRAEPRRPSAVEEVDSADDDGDGADDADQPVGLELSGCVERPLRAGDLLAQRGRVGEAVARGPWPPSSG